MRTGAGAGAGTGAGGENGVTGVPGAGAGRGRAAPAAATAAAAGSTALYAFLTPSGADLTRACRRSACVRSCLEQSHTLRVHMAALRRKLEADPARPRYLLTEIGVGYRLAAE